MSVSYHVRGIRPPDDDFKKMKAVWDSCQAAGIDPPQEVLNFFDGMKPNPRGVEVDLSVEEYEGDSETTYTVNVKDLPKGVKLIQFVVYLTIP